MNKTKKNKTGKFELSKWIHHYENKWLTIQEVQNFPLNQKIKLLILDRNIYDTTDSFKQGKLYSPTTFFKKNYAWYWKTDDTNLSGKIKYAWQKVNDEPYDFEFHVEYKINNWYPFKNGILPAKDNQGIFTLLNKDKHIKDFSGKTHLGYRGPIILWDKIKDLDKVYNMFED
jgi:hypothetical protein